MEDLVARPNPAFWAGKRVLVTGHTGFKGAWMVRMLTILGARVSGLARSPSPGPSAFESLGVRRHLVNDHRIDLIDKESVKKAIADHDLVVHMAAQAIISQALRNPADTWASNLTGTLNVLEALRGTGIPAVIVTSDKVYRNDGKLGRGFMETDPLGGDDPYSASKSACEALITSHRASFPDLPPVASARAGNVIGGGDFGQDRLIPDLVRAVQADQPLILRNPEASRSFVHVMDVVAGYLLLAEALAKNTSPDAANFGPTRGASTVAELLEFWAKTDIPVEWRHTPTPGIPDKPHLVLNSSLAWQTLHWRPRLAIDKALASTAAWYRAWLSGADMAAHSLAEIHDFLGI